VFGRNPLFIYLLSEVLLITLYLVSVGDWSLQRVFYNFFASFASPVNASFLFAFLFMMVCWTAGYFLDKKKIYIKV
jgi:predicted acyltransferase